MSTALEIGGFWTSANNAFTSVGFISIIILVIIWWTYRVAAPVHRAAHQLTTSLARMRVALESAGSGSELPARYEALHDDLKADRLLGDAWNALDSTLAKPSMPDRPFRQTVAASEFFHQGLLRTAGADMRSAQAHANMLVGAGLLLTFVGLVLALYSAGASLGSTDPAAVRSGLQQLLAASATKFLFSVVGLGLSLAFSEWLRRTLRVVDSQVDMLLHAINTRMPPLAEQDVAMEGNELLNRILAAQETFSADLAASLTTGLDQSFNTRLAEQIVPLREAVERMAASMADMNRGALNEMIERFVAQLEGAAGTQIRELTGGLERIGVQLSGLVAGLSEVQQNLADAGQTAARDIAAAMAGAAQQMAASAEATKATMDALGRDLSRATDEAAQAARTSIADGAAALGTSMSDGVEHITAGVQNALETLTAAATNAARDFGTVVAAASADLRGAAEATRGAIVQAADAFGENATRASRELAGTLAGFQAGMVSLDGRLREAEAALMTAREALDGTAGLIADASKGVTGASDRLAEAAGRVPAAMEGLHSATNAIAAAAASQRALQEDVSSLADRMAQAASRFDTLDARLAGVFQELARGLNAFRDQVREFVKDTDDGMAAAARHLRASIDSLTEALEDQQSAKAPAE